MSAQRARSGSDRYPALKRAIEDGRVKATEQPKRELRCGPWIERADGTHQCEKCGRLDPLDLMDDDDE